ncbi:MAG: hypothetical protein E7256_00780 [Lachnospiraceae bacterium]|nr:hypothetical protein [Lachnospiraceae bacterium]
MLKTVLSLGDKLELVRKNHEPFKSKLLDFKENGRLCIAMPIENGRLIPLSVGESYQVQFYTARGMFVGKGTITDRYRIKNIFMLEVEMNGELEKLQRREYYRLSCILDITYRSFSEKELLLRTLLNQNSFENEGEREKVENELAGISYHWNQAVMIDISGGGIRFQSQLKQEKGDKLTLNFPLFTSDGVRNFSLYASVITSRKVEQLSGTYEHRAAFIDISREERESIVRYIFDEDRKRRRKKSGL